MNLKGNLFSIVLIALTALIGCDSAQKMVMDSMPAEATLDKTDMEAGPVNLVWFIHYPEPAGHEASEAYFNALHSIIFTPASHEPVANATRIYQNIEDSGPLWFLEFEFDSFLDAKAYMNRPDIMSLFDDITRTTLGASSHIFLQRSDYDKQDLMLDFPNPIKGIILVDYHIGGKAAYLEWIASISDILIGPPELKAIASYDNASGESPHRLVTLEFENKADATAYEALEAIMAIEAELDVRTANWSSYTFEFRIGADPAIPEPEPIEDPESAPHTIEYSSGLMSHFTAEQFEEVIKDLESRTFENAAEAIASEKVVAHIDSVKSWAAEYCEQKFSGRVPPPEFFINFRTEEERQKFFDAMPGVYVTLVDRDAYLDLIGDSVFEPDPLDENPPWWAFIPEKFILDNTSTYFGVEILPAFPCEMLR